MSKDSEIRKDDSAEEPHFQASPNSRAGFVLIGIFVLMIAVLLGGELLRRM